MTTDLNLKDITDRNLYSILNPSLTDANYVTYISAPLNLTMDYDRKYILRKVCLAA